MAIQRRLHKDLATVQPRLVDIAGRVSATTGGAVNVTTGKGFTVTKTGTGLYKIVLDASPSGKVPDILHVAVDVGFATGTAQNMVKVLTIVPSTATITLQTSTTQAPDTAANLTSGAFLMLRVLVQNITSTQ